MAMRPLPRTSVCGSTLEPLPCRFSMRPSSTRRSSACRTV